MKTSNCLVINLWYNSLPRYGQIKPFFSISLDFFKDLKNSISQLAHLYFSFFRINFFLTIIYIFKQIHITKVFSIFGGKKTSYYLIKVFPQFFLFLNFVLKKLQLLEKQNILQSGLLK